jgi:hypothetical protein
MLVTVETGIGTGTFRSMLVRWLMPPGPGLGLRLVAKGLPTPLRVIPGSGAGETTAIKSSSALDDVAVRSSAALSSTAGTP